MKSFLEAQHRIARYMGVEINRAGSRATCVSHGIGIGLLAAGLGGCIQVSAPKKPIEINLNINVRQELVVRLRQDAQDFVTSNPELFPK